MKSYLDQLIHHKMADLSENPRNEDASKKLMEGTYCSLLLFNKLQRILLDAYLREPTDQPAGEFEKFLKKILIRKLKRVIISGKRGRGVFCSMNRHKKVRKNVNNALGDPNETKALTSTKLRKHQATISQILRMDNGDLDQLATFISTKTHKEWYRLPSNIYQTAKVSKILILSQKNNIDQ
ncbi:hypothetical protein HHI36_004870 [Cryptolaemus montrouzieri]|uniref:Uncharacterized protein n=1 Tax=Cryptolaemus montrouzieri TaxID=559131 RepID=A0ABD2NT37_9CUCU